MPRDKQAGDKAPVPGPRLLPFFHPFTEDVIDPDGDGEESDDDETGEDVPENGGQPDAEENVETTAVDDGTAVLTIHGSGGDSGGFDQLDSVQPPPRYGLRVISWNLQDLGGGPSRGPKRDPAVIQGIARILVECDPDIVAILEVKRRLWLPPRPASPQPPPRTRARGGAAAVDDEYQRRQQEYEEKLAEWELLRAEAQKTDPANAPGYLELDEIVKAMNALTGDRGLYDRLRPEQAMPPEQVFTEGESYGFIVNTEVVSSGTFELVTTDRDGGPLHWPEVGYRAPARGRFLLHRSIRPIDVIAFHAPAPSHGEITHQAIQSFSRVKWETDTIVAGDFNVDTEAGDAEASEAALDTLLSFYDGGSCDYWASVRAKVAGKVDGTLVTGGEDLVLTGLFRGWFTRPGEEDDAVAEADLIFEGTFQGYASSTGDNHQGGLTLELAFKDARVQPIEPPDGHQEEHTLHAALLRAHKTAMEAVDEVDGEDEVLDGWMMDALDAGQAPWSAAAESGRTSLRRKVLTKDFDPFDGTIGCYPDTETFNNAGYDKVFVRPVIDAPYLRPIAGWAYPLFERCLAAELRHLFDETLIEDPEPLADPWAELPPPNVHVEGIKALRAELEELANQREAEAEARAEAEPQDTIAAIDGAESDEDDPDDEDWTERGQQRMELALAGPDDEQLRLCAPYRNNISGARDLLQQVLGQANKLSDHVPMILDVEIL